jgi:AP-1 complex subunit mu
MDETIDYGYPQITDTGILKEYIKTESNKKKINSTNTIDSEADNKIASTITTVVPWRKEGIIHPKNEIFMDVIERVTCLIAANNSTIRSEVRGVVKVRCYLSGMPVCTLGLNDKAYFELQGKYDESMKNKTIEMDDFKFHQCVNMNKFESEREIEFTPADGEFDLMSYRLDIDLKPLIWVEVTIDVKSETRMDYNIKARANFKPRSIATNCDIFIPVPSDVIKAEFKPSMGTGLWDASKEKIVWNLKHFQGQVEVTLKASLAFPSVRIGILYLFF